MNRIALVEDSERLGSLLCKALKGAGIEADHFLSAADAWRALDDGAYAAMVVDRGLPDGDGLDLVKRVRGAGNAIPCLMLTARDALHDRIDGLESGADDYLTKPFSMAEVVARVRALMRRAPVIESPAPGYADLQVLPQEACLRCGGESVTLAPAELQIMLALVRSRGQVARRTALEAAAWGHGEAVTANALDVAIHRLRKKIQAIGSPVQIVNHRGRGYGLQEDTAAA